VKVLLVGWFMIKMYNVDSMQHNYLLEDSIKNTVISATLKTPLSYGENTWIKLQIVATCDTTDEIFEAPGSSAIFHKNTKICDSEEIKELKCTEKNSFIVNGIPYC